MVFAALAFASAAPVLATPPAPACQGFPRMNAVALREVLHPRGPATIVHVWASWCRPCLAEWPPLADFLRSLEGRGVGLVILSLDDEDRADAAARVLRQVGAPGCGLRAGADEAAPVLRGLDPEWDGALPATFVLDGDGRLVLAQRGVTDMEELRGAIDRTAPPIRPKPDRPVALPRRPIERGT
jgi:thiol-disulfide isomerase/thioredoxin